MMKTKKQLILLLLLGILWSGMEGQTVLTPTDDSYIYAAGLKANDPYGMINPDTLKTRKSVSSEEFTRETYVLFNIGPFDTTFSSVKVKLYGTVAETKRTQIFSTDTSWLEETLTGNNRPSGLYISDITLEPGTGYYSWDVTNYVNQAVSEGRQRVSFIFKDIAGAISTKDTPWHSKENPSGKAPLIELVPGPLPYHRNGTYYVDPMIGNDSNSAEKPSTAWKSLNRVNAEYFVAGDSILFICEGVWNGQLAIKGSGMPGKPIVIGSYESGNKPVINGSGLVTNTVQFNGQHHIELQDLHVTNLGSTVDFRRAIYFQAEDMGPIGHIILRRVEVSDVNGSIDNTDASKNNGGIIFEISGTARQTWFDTLIIEDCYIHDVDRSGIANLSTWENRTLEENTNWVPSRNIIIRGNLFENTGANALIVRVADKPLIEHNLFTHCATKVSGNASFNFNTDGALWQYNEACYTKFNTGDEDAGGFDSDFKSNSTIFQYNYSHDNDWGAVLVTGGPTGGFNDRTTIRYNLFVNNKHHEIKTSGQATNTLVYNNTIYNRPTMTGIIAVYHKSWSGYSLNTYYYNNIFQIMGSGASIDLGGSGGNVFDYNVFYGAKITNEPADAHKIKSNPMIFRPDSAGYGADTISGYRLLAASPAINSGMVVTGHPDKDIEGSVVPMYEIPDRGAYEYNGPYGITPLTDNSSFHIYPNPASDHITIGMKKIVQGPFTVHLYSLGGVQLFEQNLFFPDNASTHTISLKKPDLKSGCYILKLYTSDTCAYESLLLIDK
ncbi:MAG: DNRLRE domain-containing protein [Bacteroidetes bacterium]|nr:DNRLRE domain-containing protein [Bacteroidota bacterium]